LIQSFKHHPDWRSKREDGRRRDRNRQKESGRNRKREGENHLKFKKEEELGWKIKSNQERPRDSAKIKDDRGREGNRTREAKKITERWRRKKGDIDKLWRERKRKGRGEEGGKGEEKEQRGVERDR
jgi:hypothetical protein